MIDKFCLYTFTCLLFAIIFSQQLALATNYEVYKAALETSYELPQELIDYMASRKMRYHHYLWHNIRNLWNKFDNSTQEQLRQLGWEPPRPALRYDELGLSYRIEDNDSGEDFLYMHRQMINQANEIMKKYPAGKIEGFKTIPIPGDQEYPSFPIYAVLGEGNQNLNNVIVQRKSDDFYWEKIKPAEDLYTDPSYLRTLTLGQLGSRLEFTIHNWLHIRFSQESAEYRPSSADVMPDIDEKWDDPTYNWLGDTYASHVHPMFWKIHGWIDDRIEDWKKANNITTINWKGTWEGGLGSAIHDLLDTGHNDAMESEHNNHEEGNQQHEQTHEQEQVQKEEHEDQEHENEHDQQEEQEEERQVHEQINMQEQKHDRFAEEEFSFNMGLEFWSELELQSETELEISLKSEMENELEAELEFDFKLGLMLESELEFNIEIEQEKLINSEHEIPLNSMIESETGNESKIHEGQSNKPKTEHLNDDHMDHMNHVNRIMMMMKHGCDIDYMEAAMKVLLKTGLCSSFYDRTQDELFHFE